MSESLEMNPVITPGEAQESWLYRGLTLTLVLRLLRGYGSFYCGYVDTGGQVLDDPGAIDVHGGIAWSMSGVYGFDSAHYDSTPVAMDHEWARAETEHMADQIIEALAKEKK